MINRKTSSAFVFDLNKQVIFEDQDLMVINKPAGLVVNDASTHSQPTVQQWFQTILVKNTSSCQSESWRRLLPDDFNNKYGSPEEIFQSRKGLVHRLDQDTSGLLLLAKNPGALVNLLAQFRLRQVKKTYLCLVHGAPQPSRGLVDLPIGRNPKNRKQFTVLTRAGRFAQTHYQMLRQYYGVVTIGEQIISYSEGLSLVSCSPLTGRTHQVRVHMRSLRCPLVGDKIYNNYKKISQDSLWCGRQFLHNWSLIFAHPRSGEVVSFQAPLTADLQQVLKRVQ